MPEGEATTAMALDRTSSEIPHGRRRANSRHARSRALRLPRTMSAFLRLVVPAIALLLVGTAATVAFLLAPPHPGPLPAALALATVLSTIVVVFLVGLRLGLSTLSAVIATALAALAPPAVRAATVGVPEHLAILALLIAAGLLTLRARLRLVIPIAAVLAGAAAAIAPVALVALPFLCAQALAVLRRTHRMPTLAIAGALYFAVVTAGWALVGFDTSAAPHFGFATLSDWLSTDPVGTVVGIVALVLAATQPAFRPFAGFSVALLVLSVWPDGDESVRYTVLLAPLFALLIGAAADRALAALGRHAMAPRLVGVAGATAVALAITAGVSVSALELRDRAVAADLTQPVPTGEPEPTAVVTATPTPTPIPDTPEEKERRESAGEQVAQNPRLTLENDSADLLASGSVDRRIAVVLGQLLSEHDLTVAGFPAVDGEDPTIRRQILVTAMDGSALRPGGASMSLLGSYLSGLTGTFAVDAVTVTSDGVLATFPVPATSETTGSAGD